MAIHCLLALNLFVSGGSENGQPKQSIAEKAVCPVMCAASSAESSQVALASGAVDNVALVYLVDWRTGHTNARLIERGATTVSRLRFSPDGKSLLSFSSGAVILWDIHNRRKVRQWTAASEEAAPLCFSDDGRFFAFVREQRENEQCEIAIANTSGVASARAFLYKGVPHALAFSPNGKLLATGGRSDTGNRATVWDIENGSIAAATEKLAGPVNDIGWVSQRELITISGDGSARAWAVNEKMKRLEETAKAAMAFDSVLYLPSGGRNLYFRHLDSIGVTDLTLKDSRCFYKVKDSDTILCFDVKNGILRCAVAGFDDIRLITVKTNK